MSKRLLIGIIFSALTLAYPLSATAEIGAILPIEAILSQVRQSFQGDIVGIELEHEKGAWVYEVKVASSGGRLIEIYVDARTGSVISQRIRRKGSWD